MAEKTMDKLKKIFGFADEYEYEDFDEDFEDDVKEAEVVEPTYAPKNITHTKAKPRVSTSNMIITVHEPLSYDESPLIVDDLRDFKAVVLNFEQLDVDVKRQIFDFVSGGIYSLSGKIQKVTKDIFILAPKGIDIDGKVKDQIENNGFYQI